MSQQRRIGDLVLSTTLKAKLEELKSPLLDGTFKVRSNQQFNFLLLAIISQF